MYVYLFINLCINAVICEVYLFIFFSRLFYWIHISSVKNCDYEKSVLLFTYHVTGSCRKILARYTTVWLKNLPYGLWTME